ncbi:MAG TPA: hypothetical protein VGO57_09495 [Verrucomicrobiae bacterium]|jgi:hypothetical protein
MAVTPVKLCQFFSRFITISIGIYLIVILALVRVLDFLLPAAEGEDDDEHEEN